VADSEAARITIGRTDTEQFYAILRAAVRGGSVLSGFLIRVLNEQKDGYDEGERLTPILREVCAEYDIDLRHAGDYHSIGSITKQVTDAIEAADIVVADANSENENVWYEIGFADSVLSEKVICLSRDDRTLPFDRHGIRSIKYAHSDDGYASVATKLRNTLADFVRDQILRRYIDIPDARLREEEAAVAIARRVHSDNLRAIARTWLFTAARDTNREAFSRRVAIRSLSKMDQLDDALLVELCRPVEDNHVRAAVYDQLFHMRRDVDTSVWGWPAEELTKSPVLEAFARAAARYWLDGRLEEDWFRQRVSASADSTMRRALLSALQELVGEEARARRAAGEPTS
jgi:hypothetical protein